MVRHPKIWLVAAALVVAAVASVLVLARPSASRRPAPGAQARVYLNATACLLTNPSGIAPGGPGAPVWGAMEKASLATHVMVSYLPASGPAEVPVLLNTLVERRCGVIIAAGQPLAGSPQRRRPIRASSSSSWSRLAPELAS